MRTEEWCSKHHNKMKLRKQAIVLCRMGYSLDELHVVYFDVIRGWRQVSEAQVQPRKKP